MKVTLVYPPLCDPTCGYLSLPYLASYVRARRSYEISILDANIESLHFLSEPRRVAALIERAQCRMHRLKTRAPSAGAERHLLDDLRIGLGIEPADVRKAMTTLRDPAKFYQYALYDNATSKLRRWVRLLGSEGHGGMFEDFFLSPRLEVNCSNLAELTLPGTLEGFLAPFREYVEEDMLPALRAQQPTVVGIGVTYHEQLPFALAFAREIRRALPFVRILMGGTDISQVFKYSRHTGAFEHLLRFADAFVIGEGESAFLAILDAHNEGKEVSGAANVIWSRNWPPRSAVVPRYELLNELSTPTYRDLPHDRYLSPEPFVYYSPTRGCYWDKCTFCDYGLAGDRPTSPWRQRSLDRVVNDLRAISREARFVYFSVDVIAPAYLVRLAERLIAEKIDLRWGAELRLERYLDDSKCSVLRRSGCVGLSVGFESGNQRVLDLINKGTNSEDVRSVVASLSRAGICVQIMGFTGFPTETAAEALESVSLLEDMRDRWTFGGLGTFTLTAGAIVAKEPSRFGIANVSARRGDDVHFILDYVEAVPSKTAQAAEMIDLRVRGLRHPCELPRPFVGGIDTAHSYFYFDQFRTNVRDELDRPLSAEEGSIVSLAGNIVDNRARPIPDADSECSDIGSTEIILPDGRSVDVPRCVRNLEAIIEKKRTYSAIQAELRNGGGAEGRLLSALFNSLAEAGLIRFHPEDDGDCQS